MTKATPIQLPHVVRVNIGPKDPIQHMERMAMRHAIREQFRVSMESGSGKELKDNIDAMLKRWDERDAQIKQDAIEYQEACKKEKENTMLAKIGRFIWNDIKLYFKPIWWPIMKLREVLARQTF
jgi:hypothetical protein